MDKGFRKSIEYERGHHTWCALLQRLVLEPAGETLCPQARFVWYKTILQCVQGASVGVVLRRNRMGAMVASISCGPAASSSGVLPGSVILDINGHVVTFESFSSIQQRIETMPRPLTLRCVFGDMVYDAIVWDRDLGLTLFPASDMPQVESVEQSSVAWGIGVRTGDIIIGIDNGNMPDIDFEFCLSRDFGSNISIEFLGPRRVDPSDEEWAALDTVDNQSREVTQLLRRRDARGVSHLERITNKVPYSIVLKGIFDFDPARGRLLEEAQVASRAHVQDRLHFDMALLGVAKGIMAANSELQSQTVALKGSLLKSAGPKTIEALCPALVTALGAMPHIPIVPSWPLSESEELPSKGSVQSLLVDSAFSHQGVLCALYWQLRSSSRRQGVHDCLMSLSNRMLTTLQDSLSPRAQAFFMSLLSGEVWELGMELVNFSESQSVGGQSEDLTAPTTTAVALPPPSAQQDPADAIDEGVWHDCPGDSDAESVSTAHPELEPEPEPPREAHDDRIWSAWADLLLLVRQTLLFHAVHRSIQEMQECMPSSPHARAMGNLAIDEVRNRVLRENIDRIFFVSENALRNMLPALPCMPAKIALNPLWPIPSPLKPSTLLTGIDLQKCRILRDEADPTIMAGTVLLVFRCSQADGLEDKYTVGETDKNDNANDVGKESEISFLFRMGRADQKPSEVHREEFITNFMAVLDDTVLAQHWQSGGGGTGAEANNGDYSWRLRHLIVRSVGAHSGIWQWPQDALLLQDIIEHFSTPLEASTGVSANTLAPGKVNPFLVFLRTYNAKPSDPYGIDRECMETFCRTAAAAAVLQHVLGIGSRGMGNMLLSVNGTCTPVDFTDCFREKFVHGTFTEALPFTYELVRAVTGDDSEIYYRFLYLSGKAFLTLRKNVRFIINYLRVVRIADTSAVAVIHNRLRLDLDDTAACTMLRGLLGAEKTLPPTAVGVTRATTLGAAVTGTDRGAVESPSLSASSIRFSSPTESPNSRWSPSPPKKSSSPSRHQQQHHHHHHHQQQQQQQEQLRQQLQQQQEKKRSPKLQPTENGSDGATSSGPFFSWNTGSEKGLVDLERAALAQARREEKQRRREEEERQASRRRLSTLTKGRQAANRETAARKAEKAKKEAESKSQLARNPPGITRPAVVSESLLMSNKARLADQRELALRTEEKRKEAAARAGKSREQDRQSSSSSSSSGSGMRTGKGSAGQTKVGSRLLRRTASQEASIKEWQRQQEEKAVALELARLEAEQEELLMAGQGSAGEGKGTNATTLENTSQSTSAVLQTDTRVGLKDDGNSGNVDAGDDGEGDDNDDSSVLSSY